MLQSYIQIALRNLWKNKSFTIINIIGLAVGMAITLLSLLYVVNELSYDRFHINKDRIHRVVVRAESVAEGTETSSIMTAGVGISLMDEIPEVESMVRVSNPNSCFLTFEGSNYNAESLIHADSSFFSLFSFDLLSGNPRRVLEEPFTMVLSKSMAEKIFGDIESANGKLVRLNDQDTYTITGVVDDPPVNSHLRFDLICSFESLYQDPQLHLGWNGGWNYFTYLLLHTGVDAKRVEELIIPIADKNINDMLKNAGRSWNFFLQPLEQVHLNTNVSWDINTQGSRTRITLFIAVTFIILAIACINFINLTTASSLTRMKEVGVRKVTGATRRQIILQFLMESMLVSFIALIHSIIFIEVFYLWLSRQVTDTRLLENFELYNKSFFQLGLSVIFLIITVGLLAGAYPAFYMSKFKAALAVKGRMNLNSRNPIFRKILVIFQFSIAVILIIAALVIGTQLDYLLESDKGFDADYRTIISLTSEKARENSEFLKKEFLEIPGMEMAGASSEIPGRGFTRNGYIPEGQDKPLMFHALDVDYDYLEAMGIDIVLGRNFSKEYGQDADAFIINQALARQLGWDQPIGKTISRSGDHQVIGVVRDFNFSTMHDAIGPLVITLKPWRGYGYITLRSATDSKNIRDQLEEKWKTIVPNEDFDSFTLKSFIREAYGAEKEYMYMLLFCACLTLFIAALGLFGMATFILRRRYREIAVRKVFGAEMNRIFMMVSSGFLSSVLVANLIAWPVAYFIMESYFLVNFEYNGGIRWWIYLIALLFSGLIAFFVILFQIIRLGKLNPIEYIRYE